MQLLSGINRYQSTPYQRQIQESPTIWRRHNARLLDYTALLPDHASVSAPLLLVPSLINRAYVLDLDAKHSMARYLSSQGIACMVLDWGEPSSVEASYDCAGYVQHILAPAVEFIFNTSGCKVTVAGYCMGGVLVAALAQLKPEHIGAVAFLATPWDFSAQDSTHPHLNDVLIERIEAMLLAERLIPAEWIQAVFYLQNPWAFQQKFQRFAELNPSSNAFHEFMALEHWVNNGVPMAPKVAKECLIDWSQRNILQQKAWRVNEQSIDPSCLRQPAFFAIPQADRIVPKGSAMALANKLKNATIVTPSSGHVGMIVGSKAKRELWAPLSQWCHQL